MKKTLPEQNRIARYTVKYFTSRSCPEIQSWKRLSVRPDIGSAIAYAFGLNYPQTVQLLSIRGRHIPTEPFPRTLVRLWKNRKRTPLSVVDVGCGRGELGVMVRVLGIPWIGIDPSPGSIQLVPFTFATWTNAYQEVTKQQVAYRFWNRSCYDGLHDLWLSDNWDRRNVDTIVFCESIEHIREGEFDKSWPIIKELLRPNNGMFIITNWVDNHPIRRDHTGYDHIRRVDREFYDQLCDDADQVVVRRGSHLVLRFLEGKDGDERDVHGNIEGTKDDHQSDSSLPVSRQGQDS